MRYTKIDITLHGGKSGGMDNYAIILSLLTNNAKKKIIIGSDTSEIFYFSQPIHVPSNSCFEINGTLKLTDGITKNLTQDAHIGDTIIYVDNSDNSYSVGQFLSVTYDSIPTGGAGKVPRKMGACGKVKSVTPTYIEFEYPLINSMQGKTITDFLISDNARIGHTQSGIILYEVENIVFTGTGIIDCNYPTMLNVHPNQLDTTRPLLGYEESWGGNGFLIWESENIKLSGIKIQETNIAGFTIYKSSYFFFENIETYHTYMKGLTTTEIVRYAYMNYINIHDSYNEDGLSLHDDTKYFVCENITIKNTQRQALACNAGCTDNVFRNVIIENGIFGISNISGLTSPICENNLFENITISGCAYSFAMVKARNSVVNNLVINGTTPSGYCISLEGDVSGIIFNNGGCYDTTTNYSHGEGLRIIAKGAYVNECTDIEFNSFEFKRLKKALSEESGGLANDIVFNSCTLSDNTSNGDMSSPVFTLN